MISGKGKGAYMDYQIAYKIRNVMQLPDVGNVFLDGLIGIRYERFIYERVTGKFAIDMILREAEEFFADQYDDEFLYGMWRSEFWGKLMLSAARVCRMQRDEQLKKDIRASVYRVLQYQDGDGYLSTYREKDCIFRVDPVEAEKQVGNGVYYNWNIWGQKYTLWALLECAMLLDDQLILNAADRMGSHILSQFERLQVRVKDSGVMDGMASCSIMKPMLLLYRLTGREEYYQFCLDIAREWERTDNERPNLIANALSGVAPKEWYDEKHGWISKAYEMTSCFDGLCELYRLSGDAHYFTAIRRFWETLLKHESNVLGSVGYCERYENGAHYPDACTEICDVIHWMRLSHELFCLTGEAKYMEAFERAFLNAFLAGVYEDGKNCAFFVRSAGRHAAERQVGTKYQHCCLNNVPRGFVNAAESAITEDENGYYINLYLPLRTHFGKTSFRISEGYTNTGRVTITIRGARAGKMLHLRVPAWSQKTVMKVNGEEIPANCGEYAVYPLPEGDCLAVIWFDMTPEVMDFAGEFKNLPDDEYHVQRWCYDQGKMVTREMMVKHPMSVIRRGPVMLARSKRVQCSEEEMFSGETVWGRNARCTAVQFKHDWLLAACKITLKTEDREYHYNMCDLASAANRDLEDPRYFNMFV